ncbi:MAG: hypothetical protein IJA62_08005 [Ruminococcus sp.]|nr:hypothetical protein [Ruminococcus sp.]
MADLENALSGILSDPNAMMKIKALGEQLGLAGNSVPSDAAEQATNDRNNTSHVASESTHSTSGSPLELLTKADPAMLSRLAGFLPLLNNMNTQDETTALLCALRPFLSNERRRRLDDAEKILRVMRVLPFIRKSGLF